MEKKYKFSTRKIILDYSPAKEAIKQTMEKSSNSTSGIRSGAPALPGSPLKPAIPGTPIPGSPLHPAIPSR